MSTALVSPFYDVRDVIQQNHRNNQKQTVERRNTIGAGPVNIQSNNIRNFSIGNFTPVSGTSQVISIDNQNSNREHRKLDRSYSEPCANNNTNENQRNNSVNSSRYKTELCRPFEESGHCKYADKCQFAHGAHELRSLSRHPKYKTELCRTFHSKGFCPYGPRCNFIHNEDLRKLNQLVQNNKFQQHQLTSAPVVPNRQSPPPVVLPQRPNSINFSSSYNGSLGSTADSSPPSSVGSDSPSLSPVFFGEDLPLALNPCNSLPILPTPLNFDNSSTGVFNNVTDFSPMEVPLNIQTQVDSTDLGLLQQQFNAILNLNNQSTNVPSVFGDWDPAQMVGAPLSSPDSVSGDSVGSSSCSTTSSSSNTFSSCGSPSDSGKNFRLPVFNHISQHC